MSENYENWSTRKLENYKLQCYEKYENCAKKQNKFAKRANKALNRIKKIQEFLKNRYDNLNAIPIEKTEIYNKIKSRITPKQTREVIKELESQK